MSGVVKSEGNVQELAGKNLVRNNFVFETKLVCISTVKAR